MPTYIILSRLTPNAFTDPKDFRKVAKTVAEKIKKDCPKVHWRQSYATLGSVDVVDIVESSELDQVERAVLIIRGYGHATTETLLATPWEQFLDSL